MSKSKPRFPPNTWGICFTKNEYAVIILNKTEEEITDLAKKIKQKYDFEDEAVITYLGSDKNKLKKAVSKKKKRR